MASIELDHVSKRFGEVEVLRGIVINIASGEFVVLVGPSGCGKSTLLRMVAGLESLTSGEIRMDGQPVDHLPAKQRGMAMVFQSYALYPHMKVADNMSFSLRLARRPKAEIAQRVKEAAEILGLEELLDRLPRELSGGQRQRVAMGRAIVRDPKAFLFDEPLSNLDAKLRVKMRAEIKKLHQRLGRTSLYVTHDQTEAMTLADRIVVLNKGGIEQIGSPRELYDMPKNLFVGGFIGTPEMNLVNATVESGGARTTGGLVLPLPSGCRAKAGDAIVYGIRPQHISIAGEGQDAKVQVVEPTGDAQELGITAGGESLTMEVRDAPELEPGTSLGIGFLAEKSHVFAADTGERL